MVDAVCQNPKKAQSSAPADTNAVAKKRSFAAISALQSDMMHKKHKSLLPAQAQLQTVTYADAVISRQELPFAVLAEHEQSQSVPKRAKTECHEENNNVPEKEWKADNFQPETGASTMDKSAPLWFVDRCPRRRGERYARRDRELITYGTGLNKV